MIEIGIDPGVNTGLAISNDGVLTEVLTCAAVVAEDEILNLNKIHPVNIKFEDARLRVWFGSKGNEVKQGAGSIKRDCQRWEEFCIFHKIKFQAIAPKNNRTKIKAAAFEKMTGYTGRTNEHGRDAAMLVFKRKGIKSVAGCWNPGAPACDCPACGGDCK